MDIADALNEVLKYNSEAERQAFEKNIDDNPLDYTNHLVYADWLDDHNEPEEAAFRRAMGDWISKGSVSPPSKSGTMWVNPQLHPDWFEASAVQPNPSPFVFADSNVSDDVPVAVGGGNMWRNYRGMESAFRKAFQAGRQSTSSES